MNVIDRCWEDDRYFWYDAPLSGYRMPKLGAGLCRDNGEPVPHTKSMRAGDLREFAVIITSLLVAGRDLH